MARISPAKAVFDAHIEDCWAWLAWTDEAAAFGSVLKSKIPWDELQGDEKSAVSRHLNTTIPQGRTLLNALYLTMVSAFEEYLRSTIKEAAQGISSKSLTFEALRPEIRRLHIQESARLLRRVDSPPDYLVINEVDLCKALGSCVPGSTRVELNPEALSDVEGLLKLQTFFDRLRAFGVSLSFDELGSRKSVKQALGLPKSGNRDTAKALQEELTHMGRFRNRIAHTGANAADVTSSIAALHRNILKECLNKSPG